MGNLKIFHKGISLKYLLKLTTELLFPQTQDWSESCLLQFTWTNPNIPLSAKESISATFIQVHTWQLCYLKPQVEYKQQPKLKGAKLLMICAKFFN